MLNISISGIEKGSYSFILKIKQGKERGYYYYKKELIDDDENVNVNY